MAEIYPQDLAQLAYLTTKVREGRASREERDQFMRMMYDRQQLTDEQWKLYKEGQYAEDVVRTALLVAGLLLVVYLLGKTLK